MWHTESDIHNGAMNLLAHQAKQEQATAVTYIATATEHGEWLEVKVLASNATYPQEVGRCKTTDECRELVKKFGQVTWVTEYRFMKEATCY